MDQTQLTAGIPMISAHVVGEPMAADRADPGDRVGSTLKAASGTDGLDEGLLRRLFGERLVATASEEIAVHARERVVVPEAEPHGIGDELIE